jgi:FkbM family methyltransferase
MPIADLVRRLPGPLRSTLRSARGLVSRQRQKPSPSYAQCGEDLILSFAFQWLGIGSPTYLDVGAHHPKHLSNTALLYRRGSRGVNVEPNVRLFDAIRKARKRDVNLNIGIADVSSEMDFFVMSAPELSTFSEADAERVERAGKHRIVAVHAVRVEPLNQVMDTYFSARPPDLLSLDVEGLDYRILKSADFSRHRPLAICVESIEYVGEGIPKKNEDLTPLLDGAGYFVFADTFVNTIYLHRRRVEEILQLRGDRSGAPTVGVPDRRRLRPSDEPADAR